MPRFPINNTQIIENKVKIAGDDHKHIVRVLRFRVNDKIILYDEDFNEYNGIINSVSSKDLIIEITGKQKSTKDSIITINLYQAVPKGNKIDSIIQKASELGVNSITPIRTERSIVKESRKLARWSKIAAECCKQCGRSKPTYIRNFLSFKEIFNTLSKDTLNLLFYENEKSSLKDFLRLDTDNCKEINIIIGPEGGFTESEIQLAIKNYVHIVGLGPRILKVDTASTAAVSIIQYHFGDF